MKKCLTCDCIIPDCRACKAGIHRVKATKMLSYRNIEYISRKENIERGRRV